MKQFLIVLLTLVSVTCFAGTRKTAATAKDAVRLEKLTNLISEYSSKDGFEVIKVGRLGTSLVKNLIKFGLTFDNDPEAEEFIKAANGIRRLAIVEYDSCSQADKDSFNRKVERFLNDDTLIMEAKDDGDIVKIFGVVDDKSDKIGDFVLYAPSECAMICLFGTIPLSSVSSMMK